MLPGEPGRPGEGAVRASRTTRKGSPPEGECGRSAAGKKSAGALRERARVGPSRFLAQVRKRTGTVGWYGMEL